MNILEFGCGTGATAIYHAPHVQHIEAVDISENMLEIGRTKAREACIDNIIFTRATLTELNAESTIFDEVLWWAEGGGYIGHTSQIEPSSAPT
ncbi:class I SAM-dependent methyltransferase [Microbulbifer sp. A4B17]|uniref:class I SAM-dependent methyltransferase n=1 Tax=Microbulbifer sp. A4B17 TaxID=359370 RepID=UPI001EDF417F|nr:class I SAM-dependent methyltransferase [Microbulbifer sp. A4B17]